MINVVCGIRSTGRICTDKAKELEAQGHEVRIAYGREEVPAEYRKYAVRVGTDTDVRLHALKARVFDAAGFGSRKATERFVAWVRKYDPDEIHLHNLHGYYINVEVLFQYLKTCGRKITWTLHDCWAFTGHCVYFTMAKCDWWKGICHDCPNKKEYPASYLLDRSTENQKKKRELFSGVPEMTLVTPSQWLADLVKQSFLQEYPVEVRYNTIDKTVFKPTPSDFRERYGLQDKKVLLGVASSWDKRKGLEDFIELSEMLDDSYAIVLVGADEKDISRSKRKQMFEKLLTRHR